MRVPWKHAGVAALALAGATAVRWALDPFLAFHLPYVTYFVAIVFIAWRTSTPVALIGVTAGWLAADYLFIPPRFSLSLATLADWIGSIAYFCVGLTIVFIADRMRVARRESARSESQLHVISRRLPALVSYVSAERRYVWCNEEYTRWFGLARGEIMGRSMAEVLGQEAWRAISPHFDAALAGQFVEYETEAHYARGGTRWIHASYSPHRDASGEVVGVIVMVTDIGERKRAERNSELLVALSQAFATSPSADDAAQQVMKQLVERLGLSRCLLGEADDEADVVRVTHQHSREPEPSQAGDYRVSDFLTAAERARLADGLPLVINDVRTGRSAAAAARFHALGIGAVVSVPYVAEGKRKFALAAEKRDAYEWKPAEVEILREVAARICIQLDRARAEQTLRDSERRYRSLAFVLTDVPCTVDPIGRFVTPQPAWTRYTGQDFQRCRDFGWFDAVHPEDRESARMAWVEALHACTPYEVRVRLWHEASGMHRHVIARATPLLDDAGRIREWVGACTDIHDETEQARALVAADRRKDEFLATLAHELRNPLAPMRNSLHILKLTGGGEGGAAHVHQMLERQMNHLIRLVDDLMEVSRITRSRIELRKRTTDLQAIVRSAIETSQPLIEEGSHRLEVNLPPEAIRLEADPMRIAQAITNLLNNSAKYTDAGGRIEVTARREGSNAVIAVRDNGRGISPDMLPRVFDLFAQASPGADQARGGLGIGLTLVRSLVEMHGGGVEARSAGLGRGSEFIVRLPLSGVAEGALPHPPGTGGLASSHRVLVVDENRDAADSLGVLLTLLGAETRSATDGGAALEALDGFRPTAILIDVGMRWMDVFEIARRVRAHAQGRQAALIALVARGEKRDDKRSRECGIDHHLSKPVDLEELRKLFAELPYVPDNGAAGTMAAAR